MESVDKEKRGKISQSSDGNESLPNPEGYKGVQHLGNKEVLLIDETGGKKVVNAAENTPKNTPKKPKKKNMNEEAANYYSYMFIIQKQTSQRKDEDAKTATGFVERETEESER